jgi:hypothetical protein
MTLATLQRPDGRNDCLIIGQLIEDRLSFGRGFIGEAPRQ